MAPPPHKIQKQLVDNNTQDLTSSKNTCSRKTCCKNNNTSNPKRQTQESTLSVKPSQKSGTSKLTNQSENSTGKLISNLKPDYKNSNLKPKLLSGGVSSSKPNTNPKQGNNSDKKITDSDKSIITVMKAKENSTFDSSKSKVGESKNTFKETNIVITRTCSNGKIMTQPTKKAKQKKMNSAALANKAKRNLVNSVNVAIKSQKIFLINSANPKAFPSIRSALKSRGWFEKSVCEVMPTGVHSRVSETSMRLLKEVPAYFHWSVSCVDFSQIKNFVMVNRFPKNIHFTSKVGLCSFLQDFHWFYTPNIADTIIPRTFNIANEKDVLNFTQYYVLSACICLLKNVVDTVNQGESNNLFTDGKVPAQVIDFAILHCDAYVRFKEHRDIDTINDSSSYSKDSTEFLNWFYEITQNNASFITMTFPVIHATYSMCKLTLKQITPYWDFLHLEGTKNLWIIKPANMNCGRGVYVKKTLEDIVKHVQQRTETQYGRFVVQRYIERPLLIFNTKFDIRQWFLITSAFPLVIWIYRECYLRFSSQQFSLDNLHESVHLTNNSVQCNYTNGVRHQELPKENMWHCNSFKRYLDERGLLDKWNEMIFPGMCKGIVGAVLASQDEMLERSKSFELYGADFLIGEDFTTMLIEINSGPCMRYTTSVTESMCQNCLEDLIKVVVDRRDNPNADTGKFMILYKQEMGPKFNSCGLDLTVVGTKIKSAYKPKLKATKNK